MPMSEHETLEAEIMAILKRYSGRKTIALDGMIGRDVGIYGGDGVQAAEEIEEKFNVDLRPLIEEHSTNRGPSWIDRLLGRRRGRQVADMSVRDLVEFVARNGEPNREH
jgi:hypothetical protein